MKLILGFEPAIQEELVCSGIAYLLENQNSVLSLVRDKQNGDGDSKYYKRIVEIKIDGNMYYILNHVLVLKQLKSMDELTYVCLSGEADELTTFSYEGDFESTVIKMRNYLDITLLLRGDK